MHIMVREGGLFQEDWITLMWCLSQRVATPKLWRILDPSHSVMLFIRFFRRCYATGWKQCFQASLIRLNRPSSPEERFRTILWWPLIPSTWWKINEVEHADVALKIDISKAYDRNNWNYLEDILLKMGFANIWVNWMMLWVKSVSYLFIVNKNFVSLISLGRGLR